MNDFSSIPALPVAAREALRRLNNANAEATSHLEPAEWETLLAKAHLALAPVAADALLIAFSQDADYASPNFLWFAEQYERFLYVDRIVVVERARGRGLARALYTALADAARTAGLERIVCEVNRIPPTPGSDAFHARLGFQEVGRAHPYGDAKLVRYLALELEDAEPR
ncbi:MAG: GNAT family N-acetyltransferase [Pseudomonadota bacterium]